MPPPRRGPSKAKEIAEDWYLELRGKLRNGETKTEKTFREPSEQYLREYDIITQGQRSQKYVEDQHWRSRLHLVPFFGDLGLSEIHRRQDPGISHSSAPGGNGQTGQAASTNRRRRL